MASCASDAFLPSEQDYMVSPSLLSTLQTLPHSCTVESLSNFQMFVTDILNLVERAAMIDLIMPILSFSADTGGFQGGKRMHEGSVTVY